MTGFGPPKKNKTKRINLSHKYIDSGKLISKAIQFHSQGSILEASKCYQLFIDKGFKDPRVLINYGVICQQKGELDKAKLLFQELVELFPQNPVGFSNLGGILKEQGKLNEAEFYLRKAIELKPDFADAYSNLGTILQDLGKLVEAESLSKKAIEFNSEDVISHFNLSIILKDQGKLIEAELFARKAIKINPGYAKAYYALGVILKDQGKLIEAELSRSKSIKLNPNYARSYFSISTIKNPSSQNNWQTYLFSEDILKKQTRLDSIDIYFARANIMHNQKNYEKSTEFLLLANKLKLEIYPSDCAKFIDKSKELITLSNQTKIELSRFNSKKEHIFIVGMPRSGSTLLESIITMNPEVNDLGEDNIFEKAFLEWENNPQALERSTLSQLYSREVDNIENESKISTNKWLYNYQYTGIISSQLANAKIIHCHRNPLDNILSIYRANFASGNKYSSSLVDSARVYLDQDQVMTEYKKQYPTKIYDLNYDSLVNKPKHEIRSLISWLGWDWNDSYLSPHLNSRSVSTASNVQVRSPINSKSVGGWKYYQKMLKPAIALINQSERYADLITRKFN